MWSLRHGNYSASCSASKGLLIHKNNIIKSSASDHHTIKCLQIFLISFTILLSCKDEEFDMEKMGVIANQMDTGDTKRTGATIKNDDEAIEKAKGVCQKLLMQSQRAKLAIRQCIKTAGGQM